MGQLPPVWKKIKSEPAVTRVGPRHSGNLRFRAWRRCACAHGTDTETPGHSAKNGPRICRFRCRTHRHSGPESPRRKRSQGAAAIGPPASDPKGVPLLYWLWATCTHKTEKFRRGVKTPRPVQRIPQQITQGHSEAPALWISFPSGKLETEGRSDKKAASCARGISLHPWYAGQLSAIHFWDRYTQIAKRLGIWK